MKLNTTLNKLSLIALLSVGLACAPLAVNADDGHRGWHGHHQQDRGKSHHKVDYRSDFRGFGHRNNHRPLNSCRVDHKHGYKKGHHKNRSHGYNKHQTDVQRHYRVGQHERYRLSPGSYLGSLAVLFYD